MQIARYQSLASIHTECRKHAAALRLLHRHIKREATAHEPGAIYPAIQADLCGAIAAVENAVDNITRELAPPGNPPPLTAEDEMSDEWLSRQL